MDDSKSILEKIAEEERKNKEQAEKILKKKNSVYQKMSIEAIEKVFKFRDELRKPYKTFLEVNGLLKELSEIYPGYLSFISKADSWETGHNPTEVRFLVDYLLTGKWTKDGDFWRVVNQIADHVNVPSNPFRNIGGADGQ
jgi:hypothetical protein